MVNHTFSLVIPTYNEEGSIVGLLQKITQSLKKNAYACDIIIVNDGSTDATSKILAELEGVRVISHQSNRGYGAALKTGINAARHNIIVTLDSDGQHSPDDIPRLLAHIDGYDAVIGMRDRNYGHAWALCGKWFLRLSISRLLNKRIPDLNFGFRAYRRESIVELLPRCSDRFSFSTTILLQLLHRNARVTFVPIAVHKRIGKSKVTVMAGYHSLCSIFRVIFSFSPFTRAVSYFFLIGCAVLFCLAIINNLVHSCPNYAFFMSVAMLSKFANSLK